MASVSINKSLDGSEQIWRYMPLDKFIDIIVSETLFFTPLQHFQKNDPFEGGIPRSAIKAIVDAVSSVTVSPSAEHRVGTIDVLRKFTSGIQVNCWHNNNDESEAMWKLYSGSHSGVAIKTSVSRLAQAIIDPSDAIAAIGRVKYFDFFDDTIPLHKFVNDGQLFPLLKRKSFEHEREIRVYITQQLDGDMDQLRIDPVRLKVDPRVLIERVVLSPYSNKGSLENIKKVCEKFGIANDICVDSALLQGVEKLYEC